MNNFNIPRSAFKNMFVNINKKKIRKNSNIHFRQSKASTAGSCKINFDFYRGNARLKRFK